MKKVLSLHRSIFFLVIFLLYCYLCKALMYILLAAYNLDALTVDPTLILRYSQITALNNYNCFNGRYLLACQFLKSNNLFFYHQYATELRK